MIYKDLKYGKPFSIDTEGRIFKSIRTGKKLDSVSMKIQNDGKFSIEGIPKGWFLVRQLDSEVARLGTLIHSDVVLNKSQLKPFYRDGKDNVFALSRVLQEQEMPEADGHFYVLLRRK